MRLEACRPVCDRGEAALNGLVDTWWRQRPGQRVRMVRSLPPPSRSPASLPLAKLTVLATVIGLMMDLVPELVGAGRQGESRRVLTAKRNVSGHSVLARDGQSARQRRRRQSQCRRGGRRRHRRRQTACGAERQLRGERQWLNSIGWRRGRAGRCRGASLLRLGSFHLYCLAFDFMHLVHDRANRALRASLAHHQFLHQVVRKNLENLMSDHLKKL